MNIPNFEDIKVVDEHGMFTPGAKNMFEQAFLSLIQGVGQEGYQVTQLDQDTVNLIEPNAPEGTLVHDVTNNAMKLRLNDGTFHEIEVKP